MITELTSMPWDPAFCLMMKRKKCWRNSEKSIILRRIFKLLILCIIDFLFEAKLFWFPFFSASPKWTLIKEIYFFHDSFIFWSPIFCNTKIHFWRLSKLLYFDLNTGHSNVILERQKILMKIPFLDKMYSLNVKSYFVIALNTKTYQYRK